MFMSVNTERFWEAQPYLVEFILNRERKYLPPHLKFYAYYTISEATRMMGVSASPPQNQINQDLEPKPPLMGSASGLDGLCAIP